MSTYRFVTIWRLEAPREEVWALLNEPSSYPQWWPALEHVDVLDRGDRDGIGRRTRATLRSRLPFELGFETVVRELREPEWMVLEATGELEGIGRWELRHADKGTTATYTWEVDATKWWMRLLGPLGRPAFAWNHHQAMRQAAHGLADRIGARLIDEESHPPVRAVDWAPLAGLVAAPLALAVLARRSRRSRSPQTTGWMLSGAAADR